MVSILTKFAEQTRSSEGGRPWEAPPPPPPHHLFHQEKTTVEAGTRIEDNFQGIFGQHLNLWCKASDRGDPAQYVGHDIEVQERGGGESRKGMR